MTLFFARQNRRNALTTIIVTSSSAIALFSCGYFQRSSKEQRQRVQTPLEETTDNDDLMLDGNNQEAAAGGTPNKPLSEPESESELEETAEPSPEAEDKETVLIYADVETILLQNCGTCHANGLGTPIMNFNDYAQLKDKVIDSLTTSDPERLMPRGNTTWLSTPDGQLVLKYFQQEGELRP